MKTKTIPSSARSAQAVLFRIGLAIGLLGISTGCSREEIARWSIAQAFDGEDWDWAVRVARCESGFDPEAVSPGNYGLFQINNVNKGSIEAAGLDWERVKWDAWENALAARVVLVRQGRGAWTCK